MKKTTLIFFFALFCGCQLFAQVNDAKADNLIYQQLIDQLGFSSNIPIYCKTSAQILKRVNFKNEHLYWTDKGATINTADFLRQIKLDNLNELTLTEAIGTHPFTNKKYSYINTVPQPFLSLSPIIYSNDGSLALCSVQYWSDPEAAGETIYVLEHRGKTWQVVKFLLVSIS